jgi:hypothetical protein
MCSFMSRAHLGDPHARDPRASRPPEPAAGTADAACQRAGVSIPEARARASVGARAWARCATRGRARAELSAERGGAGPPGGSAVSTGATRGGSEPDTYGYRARCSCPAQGRCGEPRAPALLATLLVGYAVQLHDPSRASPAIGHELSCTRQESTRQALSHPPYLLLGSTHCGKSPVRSAPSLDPHMQLISAWTFSALHMASHRFTQSPSQSAPKLFR